MKAKKIVTMFVCMAVAMADSLKEMFDRQKGKEGEHE